MRRRAAPWHLKPEGTGRRRGDKSAWERKRLERYLSVGSWHSAKSRGVCGIGASAPPIREARLGEPSQLDCALPKHREEFAALGGPQADELAARVRGDGHNRVVEALAPTPRSMRR